ncbi:MAG: 3-methyl-2-oxobutanoate hydroxymethyltransferase [Phycisphaerales bacterium]|nr:3-methyl-2-oxobutanoate hydroxymethyltransferase [Phycisphaerales bacterium]
MSKPIPSPSHTPRRLTVSALSKLSEPFACLTCYDATTARWLARAGVHVLLVGDTAAEMVLGLSRTIDMPLEVLLALTAGVKRGAMSGGGGAEAVFTGGPLVMGDMPFMSYHTSDDEAVRNAGRFLTEGKADLVKLEVDASFAGVVKKMTRAGVPVVAHVGSRPQRVMMTGSYSSAGRTREDLISIVRDVEAMQEAGAVMLLLEAVPDETAAAVMKIAKVPVIGIGAGPRCHGQVLVLQDLLGLTDTPPVFAAPAAQLGNELIKAGRAWVDRVARRAVGASPYSMKKSSHKETQRAQRRK